VRVKPPLPSNVTRATSSRIDVEAYG
jgi:hypothetical protein